MRQEITRANSARICVRSSLCRRRAQVGGIAAATTAVQIAFTHRIFTIAGFFHSALTSGCANVRREGTEVTEPECPWKVRLSVGVATSHSLSVVSLLPDSAVRPSGAKVTEVTESECPVKVRID